MIHLQHVTKYYGKRLAVDDISFQIGQGEIAGFLGPNAAGKTTTMRMITGALMPTRGEIRVAGYSMMTHALKARRLIGYLPEVIPLYTDMTTRAYLEFFGRLRGLDKKRTQRRIAEVVTRCHLEDYIDVLLGKLSRGFRQRVGLAQAILHDPKVLILDEPTVGIDPIQVAQTRQLIKELGQTHTILLSTHLLPEVSMICERVIIIHQGKLVAQDRIENLSSLLKETLRLRLSVQGPEEMVAACLRQIPGVREVTYDSPCHIVECHPGREPRPLITEAIVQNGWTLLAMDAVQMSLEDIFLKLITEETGI
ncbi:ABC transporter ATP-binding protein [Candidatus Entotheonella palauensis]|uniref:ABC transporter ATP-binding protein n=1 Tax=Candidatus Entotheonella palauensis TaxID=93172 RepID=UPI0004BAADF8|nr:ABC transporter ATP-binding protein [Candidatus Entotheonella palauensis]